MQRENIGYSRKRSIYPEKFRCSAIPQLTAPYSASDIRTHSLLSRVMLSDATVS